MAFPSPNNFRSLLRLAAVDITPLRRHRDYRLLYIGRFVSLFGNQITFVAVPYQVFTLTHSTFAVGLLGVVELAALLTFALIGGALADALDRRLMVLMSEAALMVGSVILFGNALLAHPIVWLVFVIVSLQGAFDAMQSPSLGALLPRLVDREELGAAAALNGVRSTLGMIAGPALAGVLIAVAGLPVAYVVDIATFVVGLVCLWLMKAMPPPADAERPSIRRIAEGLRYARSRPELMGTYFVDIIAMFFRRCLASSTRPSPSDRSCSRRPADGRAMSTGMAALSSSLPRCGASRSSHSDSRRRWSWHCFAWWPPARRT